MSSNAIVPPLKGGIQPKLLTILLIFQYLSLILELQTMNLRCPKIMNTPPQNLLEREIF